MHRYSISLSDYTVAQGFTIYNESDEWTRVLVVVVDSLVWTVTASREVQQGLLPTAWSLSHYHADDFQGQQFDR